MNSIRGEAKLNSPVDDAYKSILLCHLANISQRTGRTLDCDSKNGHILHDADAMLLWQREYEKAGRLWSDEKICYEPRWDPPVSFVFLESPLVLVLIF